MWNEKENVPFRNYLVFGRIPNNKHSNTKSVTTYNLYSNVLFLENC